MEIGERVGRTSSKEQYCYFYRTAIFEIPMSSYTYNDDKPDDFEREPYNTIFRDKVSGKEFVLSALNAKPTDAPAELEMMPTVYDDIVNNFGTTSVIMLGDFNADCSYLTSSE
ncbi:hypothetical protein, partial [Salmonella sp. s54395]|uniref:hypothetical protein n=1 Tax=Salmonella sp. s54395 TaxID=3159664 RepID=UPI0039803D38